MTAADSNHERRHPVASLDQVARCFGVDAVPESWKAAYKHQFGGKPVRPKNGRHAGGNSNGSYNTVSAATRIDSAAGHVDLRGSGYLLNLSHIESQARGVFSDPAITDRIVESARTLGSSPVLTTAAHLCDVLLFEDSGGIAPADEDFLLPAAPAGSPERLFYAPLFLARVPDLRQLHRKRHIPEDDTNRLLGDIELWIREHRRRHDEWGLSEIGWLRDLFQGRVVQLGRLQYEPTTFEWPYRVYARRSDTGDVPESLSPAARANARTATVLLQEPLPIRSDGQFADADVASLFRGAIQTSTSEPPQLPEMIVHGDRAVAGRPAQDGRILAQPVTVPLDQWELRACPGDSVVAVHIPASGPLVAQEVEESLDRARSYFQDKSDDGNGPMFTCDSWLMDPQLRRYLNPESNIVAFQSRFHLVPLPKATDHQHFERIFGKIPASLDTVKPGNTLQKALVEHVRGGGTWRMTGGILA